MCRRANEQAIADILNKHYPELSLETGAPRGRYVPGTHGFLGDGIKVSEEKTMKATGADSIQYEKSILDAAEAFERYL